MRCHPKRQELHAPDHQARATVGQTSLLKAERVRQNRAYVRKLLQERQPEFAAALAAAKEQIVRQRSAPDVTAGHKAEKHSSTGTRVECSETPAASQRVHPRPTTMRQWRTRRADLTIGLASAEAQRPSRRAGGPARSGRS
jgi:hypothetical protein